MRWLFTIILVAILAVPVISGIDYLRKNDFKIFRHPAKEDLKEEELLGSSEINDFRIAQIQHALKNFGYDPGTIDGRLGKNTRKAVKEFQIAKGISPTGKIDSRTYFELLENPKVETKGIRSEALAKRQEDNLNLKNVIPTNTSEENKKIEEPQEKTVQLQPIKLRQGSYAKGISANTKTDIKAIQLALKKLGLYHSKIDGLLGKMTRLAIKKFQRTHGLKPDGILGHKTMLCLNREG